MEDYVNVNFFWGGEIIRRDDEIRYSTRDPKRMQYIKWGTSYEELKEVVYGLMNINSSSWNLKMSFKYPQLGVGNLVSGYYIADMTCDDDVRRMLSVPRQMQMGMGDVSLYVEAEKIIPNEVYMSDQGCYSQTTHATCETMYGSSQLPDYGSRQYPEYDTPGWSDYYFGGGGNPETYVGGSSSQVNAGGSTSRAFENRFPHENVDAYVSPPRDTTTLSAGRDLALIHENEEFDAHISSSEDWDEYEDDSDNSMDDGDELEEVPTHIHQAHHIAGAPWFENEEYNPIVVRDEYGMSSGFDLQHSELSVGCMFRDKETLIAAVRGVHIKSDRNYQVFKSNPTQFIAKCVYGYCPWRLRAAKKVKHGMFEITKMRGNHTCLNNEPMQDHRKISAKLIARLIKPHVMERPNLPIMTVITMVNDEYNHRVNYLRAWRGKQSAVEDVYGKWSTTYADLPMFFTAMVHSNPGSVAVIDAVSHETQSESSVCKRIFWCLKAMMDGWEHARPVLSIDGTFLKGRYNGKLLIAMGVDSNNHQYPVCYALVDEESTENWSWFLRLLRKHVCRERYGVCIISDRAPGILAAMRDSRNGFTPPLGVHRLCLFHVRSNFSSHHPGGELKHLMWLAGITTQVRKHEAYMKQIGEISPPALQYLRNIPPELWTLAHDTGGARFGQATTNIMEGFNGNIRMARFLPVTAMMEYLFYKTVKIVNNRRNSAEDSMQKGEELCARSTAMLAKIEKKATAHKVDTFSRQRGIFSVMTHRYRLKSMWKGGHRQNVDIRTFTCTCGKWECHHMPCSHAVAGCMQQNINWRQWIEPYHYTMKLQKLWEPLILPLQPTEYWNYVLPRRWQQYGTLVPDERLMKVKKKRGEKGESVRIRTEMDAPRTGKKCSRCGQEGHTRRSLRCPQRVD